MAILMIMTFSPNQSLSNYQSCQLLEIFPWKQASAVFGSPLFSSRMLSGSSASSKACP
ncbi:MAG: hypothetical protein R2874_11770 [Desulfobacterales bacterium]